MLIVLCYKYLIMHVHIVQSDFHVRHIPFRGITARTPPFPISWSPPPLVPWNLRVHSYQDDATEELAMVPLDWGGGTPRPQ